MSLTLNETKQLVSQKRSIDAIAELRGCKNQTVVSHIARLVAAGQDLDVEYLMPPQNRLEEIKSAFLHTGNTRLAPVRILLGESYSFDEIALARIGLLQSGFFVSVEDSNVFEELSLDTSL